MRNWSWGGCWASLPDAFGLDRPHLVGPDIGTGASLFAAARHPGRFQSLVVGTGGAAVPLQPGGVLKEWVEAPSLEPYRKIDATDVANRLTVGQYLRVMDAR